MYVSFPDSVPGDSASKPEWVLKGFAKWAIKPDTPEIATFALAERDLSYWDDSPGMSKWVCAKGTFRVCIGSNARDAIIEGKGACTSFVSTCPSVSYSHKAALGSSIMKKNAETAQVASASGVSITSGFGAFLAFSALATMAIVTRRALSWRGRGYDRVQPLVRTSFAEADATNA